MKGVEPPKSNRYSVRLDDFTPAGYIIGKVEGSAFNLGASVGIPHNAILFNADGTIRDMTGPDDEGALGFMQPMFEAIGIEITEIGFYDTGLSPQDSIDLADYPTVNV